MQKQQTIKLLTPVIIAGQQASPNDKNNGVYTVTLSEARNLIARKRAIKFETKLEPNNKNNGKSPVIDIDAVKTIAEAIGVKFNNAIGAEKLQARVIDALNEKAEEIGLTFAENLTLEDMYELYKSKVAEGNGGENNKISVEELKEIATAADIEIPEGTADENLQEFIEAQLEEYANNLGIEVLEDDNAKTLWVKIQEKLKESK